MRKCLALLLSLVLVIVSLMLSAFAPMERDDWVMCMSSVAENQLWSDIGVDLSHSRWHDEKVLSTATLDDEFCDRNISVVLTRRASLRFRTYTVRDFPEIRLLSVEHLSARHERNIENQLIEMQEQTRVQSRVLTESVSIGVHDQQIESFRQILRLTLLEPSRENILHAISLLEQRSDVYGASPDFITPFPESVFVSDEMDTMQNNIQPLSATQSWALNRIQAPAAWSIMPGLESVRVGVIDSGIHGNHPSLTNIVCRVLSKDFDRTRNAPLNDTGGHGTRVAGLIASQNNNQRTGVAQNIRLVSLRIDQNGLNWGFVLEAILHATGVIPILNISLGERNIGHHVAIRQALTVFDGLAVIGAGNAHQDNDDTRNRVYPASFSYIGYGVGGNVISVGASGANEANFRLMVPQTGGNPVGSNFGARTVDIFAPGNQMRVMNNAGGYTEHTLGHGISGTSYAAPLVAGTAALMLSIAPELNGASLRSFLMYSVNRNVRTCVSDHSVSGGLLNTYQALRTVQAHRPHMVSVIRTQQQLYAVRFNPSGNFNLASDIHLSGQWNPIAEFIGTLNGQYGGRIHSIVGININRPGASLARDINIGFFATLRGRVLNMGISNNFIDMGSNSSGSGWIRAGIVAGRMYSGGEIRNVSVNGHNTLRVRRSQSSIGGFVGYMSGGLIYGVSVIGTSANFAFTLDGSGNIGGLVGTLVSGEVVRSTFMSAPNHSLLNFRRDGNNRNIGGIVGYQQGGHIQLNNASNFMIYQEGTSSSVNGSPNFGTIIGRQTGGSTFNNSSSNVQLAYWGGLFNNNRRWDHNFTRQIGNR